MFYALAPPEIRRRRIPTCCNAHIEWLYRAAPTETQMSEREKTQTKNWPANVEDMCV